MNIIPLPGLCPSCDQPHAESVAPCPLCDREWNQNVIGHLGVWDGLAIIKEDNHDDDYGYAAYVGCGCGLTGPSRATCKDAVIAWNKNVALIHSRIETGVPIDPENVIKSLQQCGIIRKEAA